MRRLLKWLARLAAAGLLLWMLITSFSIISYAQVDETTRADAAIVLGAAAYRDRPSPVFRERINHAIALYESGMVDYLIFTGGVGRNDEQSESETARDYALQAGVPDSAILLEDQSTDTYGNLAGAQAVMAAQGFDSALIVSDPLHMQRAMALAEDLGMNAYSSPTTTSRYESPWSQLRFILFELVSNLSYLAFGP